MKYIGDSKYGLVFRVPADETGFNFVKDFRKYLNKTNYKLIVRYTGKRPKGTSQISTRRENATSIRGYVESKYKVATPTYYSLGLKDEENEKMQKELLALNNSLAEAYEKIIKLESSKAEVEAYKSDYEEEYKNATVLHEKLEVISKLLDGHKYSKYIKAIEGVANGRA